MKQYVKGALCLPLPGDAQTLPRTSRWFEGVPHRQAVRVKRSSVRPRCEWSDNLLNEFYISDREDGMKPGMARTIWTGFKYKF